MCIYIYFFKKWSLVSSQSPTITSIRMHNIHSYTISVQKLPICHLLTTSRLTYVGSKDHRSDRILQKKSTNKKTQLNGEKKGGV